MANPTELISTARDALAELARVPVEGMTDGQLCEFVVAIEGLGRLVDAARVTGAGEIDDRSRRSLGTEGLAFRHGYRRSVHFLESLVLTSQAEAARRIRVGSELRGRSAIDGSPLPAPYPLVSAAVERGEIGIDSAVAIAKNLNDAAPVASLTQLAVAEEKLVAEARSLCADLVAVQASTWRTALDQDGAEPRLERLRRKRSFVIGRENLDGLTPFSGLAEPQFATTLRAAIGDRTAPSRRPRFLDSADLPEGVDELDDIVDDPRSREQRNYDVLVGLLTAGIRADSATSGPLHSTATVNVVVRASDLATGTGPAWLDDVREPISAALAAEISCDSGVTLIGVGDQGQPLWMGRRERYFTAAQRKALATRDGGCVWPGCNAPPSWCHGHHVVSWLQGGLTDIDNGVLLCAFHHHLLHQGEYRMRMIDGMPQLLSPRWIDPTQKWRRVGRSRWSRAA
ncbi:MAG TPA: DUF222 domain-containing protein [Pseudolysinimonas sp.]